MNKITYILLSAMACLSLLSCSSDNEPAPWQPAEPTNAAGIYFTGDDNILTATAGEDTRVAIPVHRLSSKGALTVPLKVTSGSDRLKVPTEVTFEDGKKDSEIVVDLADIPTRELISLTITFPDEYINPYAAGSPIFDGSVIVSDWEPVSDQPVMLQWLDWSFRPTSQFDPIPQEVWTLPGTNRYRILNFLNSGIDFSFELQASQYPGWEGYDRIVPMGNQVLYTDYGYTNGYYKPWWFVSDDLQDWPEIPVTSNGEPLYLYGTTFMWYDDEYGNEYCYMRRAGVPDSYGNVSETNWMAMACYAFYYPDWAVDWDWNQYTGYLYLYLEF